MSIGERLRVAVERRRWSIREFQRTLDKSAVPGSSYPAVHRYLAGETTPSVEFLAAAAQVLDVRPAWLAFGQGAATETDEASGGASAAYAAQVEELLRRDFTDVDRLSPWVRDLVWAVIFRWRAVEELALPERDDNEEHPDPHGFAAAAAQKVGQMLSTPFELIDKRTVSPENLDAYVASVCTSLMLLIPDPARRLLDAIQLDQAKRAAAAISGDHTAG